MSGGSRPCQPGPYSAIHPSTCTRESRWVAELAGSRRLERWASPGMPLEAMYLRGPGGPHSGEAGPEPVQMAVPTPESPLSPVCSAGASVCPARGEGRRARPGTRAGSQAPPAWLTPQPRAPGLCRPRPAGAEAHLGVQVANNRDELRNDKQQRLVLPGIPEPLSTCACPCRPPGSPGHTLLSSARREEDEPGRRQAGQARGVRGSLRLRLSRRPAPRVDRAARVPDAELTGRRTRWPSVSLGACAPRLGLRLARGFQTSVIFVVVIKINLI